MSGTVAEPSSTLVCGCKLSRLHGYLSIAFCPTHAAAPELLEGCKAALSSFELAHSHRAQRQCECVVIRAALAKAGAL